MAQPPYTIRAAVTAGPETGDVLGALETVGEHAFTSPDGRWWRAPIWLVITDRHAWLAAAQQGEAWAVGTGEPGDVDIETGWTADAVRVGGWSTTLRRGTRKAAQALLAVWEKARWGGDPWPPPDEATGRAPLARGASGFPEWWAEGVPAEPAERWLLAGRTRDRHPFSLRTGTIAEAPLWLGVSDARTVLAAHSEDGQTAWFEVEDGARPVEDGTRRRLVAGPRTLRAPPALQPVARLSRQTPAARRWADAADQAVEAGEARRALDLLGEARELRRAAHAWAPFARLLFTVGRPDLAGAALAEHLRLHPDTDVQNGPGRWATGARERARALRRDDVDEATIRALAGSLIEALERPEPPNRLPWPPSGETEVWVAALAHRGRWSDARALLGRLPRDTRGEAVRAAILTAAGAEEAAAAWRRAAQVARKGGRDAEAVDALERSIDLDDDAESRWLAAAWAWADGRDVEARRHWTRALELDPAGAGAAATPLPADAERTLAGLAERAEAWTLAADAWRRARDADPSDFEAWASLARVTEDSLEDLASAAMVWEAVAKAFDDGPLQEGTPVPRWTAWVEVARLRAAAGDQAAALAALMEALAGDFLRPETYDALLTVRGVQRPPTLQGWWRHLGRLVGGASQEEGVPLPPAEGLDDEALDALHPGGAGWLEEVRRTIELPEVPPRKAVVRGLERLTASDHEDALAVVQDVAARLGFAEPPAVFLYRGEGAWGASAWPVQPPVVLLGYEHLRSGDRHLGPGALGFLLAVELAHLRCDHPVLAFDQDLLGTSRSMYASLGRYAGTAETVFDVVTLIPGIDQVAKLQNLIRISRRVFKARGAVDKVSGIAGRVFDTVRSRQAEPLDPLAREGLRGAALQFRIQADRAALRVTGDARAAIDAILRGSTPSLALADRVTQEGLAAILEEVDGRAESLPPDEALRITMLVEFAAAQRPDLSEGDPP